MRKMSMAIALIATIALPALAIAQSGRSNMGDTPGSSNNAGNPPGGNSVQGPVTNQGGGATTGPGVGGSVGGSTTRPGGTNNEQSGTQSHDAQKGGSGKDGAR